MKFNWEVITEGKTFEELGVRGYLQSMKVTHQIPKGKKKKSSPHKAEIVLANPNQIFSGYFRQLDRFKIWLGLDDEMFYQGTYTAQKITHKANETQQPTLILSLVCSSFAAVRRYTARTINTTTLSADLAQIAKEHGWNVNFDDLPELQRPIVKSALQSDWDLMDRIATNFGNLDLYTEWPTKVRYYEEPVLTLVIKKEKYDQVLNPDKRPVGFVYGGGDPHKDILIQSYSTNIDVKKATAASSTGSVGKKGDAKIGTANEKAELPVRAGDAKSVILGTGILEQVPDSSGEDVAKTKGEVRSKAQGPKGTSPKVGVAAAASSTSVILPNNVMEHSKKAKMSIIPVLPVPWLFPRKKIPVYGIKQFEGFWDVEQVTHEFSGSSFLKSSISLKKKSAGKKAKDGTDKSKGNMQIPSVGDVTLPIYEGDYQANGGNKKIGEGRIVGVQKQ